MKDKFIYVEPESYFSPEMLEAAEKWEKEHAAEELNGEELGKNKKRNWEYVKLLDGNHKNQVVRADGRFQQRYEDGKWIRSGILLDYYTDTSPLYNMYEDITEEEAIKLIGAEAIKMPE